MGHQYKMLFRGRIDAQFVFEPGGAVPVGSAGRHTVVLWAHMQPHDDELFGVRCRIIATPPPWVSLQPGETGPPADATGTVTLDFDDVDINWEYQGRSSPNYSWRARALDHEVQTTLPPNGLVPRPAEVRTEVKKHAATLFNNHATFDIT